MSLSRECYCPVRKSEDGREWLDCEDIAFCPTDTEDKRKAMDKKMPSWAKYNPCVRIAKVEVREIEAQ